MKHGALVFVSIIGLASCGVSRRGTGETHVLRPSEVADFSALYAQNCSGCHGVNGKDGLTVGIGTPVYLAIADDTTMRRVIAEGRQGTPMQAFAQKSGGLLTDAQIDILVRGIRTRWAGPDAFQTSRLPAYAASAPGDAAHGHEVFTTACSACHGPEGRGARAIADAAYLSLVTDQHLRTVVITGMPQLGMPDWRTHATPLSDADVTDVVAWLAAQRPTLGTQLHPAGGAQ
jgi:cytochrome c oxidase cbb3-type subunit 3